MRRYTWGIFLRKSIANQNVIPGIGSFKCKSKPDWMNRKYKARYCVIVDVQNRLSPQTQERILQWFSGTQWGWCWFLQCILGLQSQIIDFANAFAQADIPSGKTVFIELPGNFKSDGGKCDVVLRLKKILYGQAEVAHLWYEKLWNGLLEYDFGVSKVDPWLFISKTVISVVYVAGFLFWARSQSEIDNLMRPFKEDCPSYNW